MKCKVKDCERDAMYKEKQLCQKHYFRLMRNGTTELKKITPQKRLTPNGYVTVYAKGHPLAIRSGRNRIFEHRIVYHDKINSNPKNCDICHADLNWSTLHIDHINSDKQDNRPENLRCLCRGCNILLGFNDSSYGTEIEVDGKKMTPTAWSREEGVKVSGATIRRRLKNGASPYEAVFGQKVTHKGKTPPKQKIKRDRLLVN